MDMAKGSGFLIKEYPEIRMSQSVLLTIDKK
jgi:hypothetical protein